jgi:Baseplate J-like protein/LysM domain
VPLPLPNLDTRRWDDLVEEGRALVPRYASTWTDHNIHDPGITLIELLAWLIEQEIYRVNRVPDRHRLKFLELIGFAPAPPHAARAVVGFARTAPTPLTLPAGIVLEIVDAQGDALPFSTLAELTIVAGALAAIQLASGGGLFDATAAWQAGEPLAVLGAEPAAATDTIIVAPGETVTTVAARIEASPEALVSLNNLTGPDEALAAGKELLAPTGPSVVLGFDIQLPGGVEISLYFELAGDGHGTLERARLEAEAAEQGTACRPTLPSRDCGPADDKNNGNAPAPPQPPAAPPLLLHHSARTVWEAYTTDDGGRWRLLNEQLKEVMDDTRALTLDGVVRLTLPSPTAARALGDVTTPLHWIRCRLVSGSYDTTPVARVIALNAVAADQALAVRNTFTITSGAVVTGTPPAPGAEIIFDAALDTNGSITSLTFDPATNGVSGRMLAYEPPGPADGSLTLEFAALGTGNGQPLQRFSLPERRIRDNTVTVWTREADGWTQWTPRPDFDASSRTDSHVVPEPTAAELLFGDGEHGRVVLAAAPLIVAYEATRAEGGNGPHGPWSLPDEVRNRALISDFDATAAAIAQGTISTVAAAAGGRAAESLAHAAGRAAEQVWAHERLLELCPPGRRTLDGVARDQVVARVAPERGANVPDLERLVLATPGTEIARVRAFADLDARLPCAEAPGTVTVVVIPYLPDRAPTPSAGLIDAVARYLRRRRIVTTRILVVGPEYLEVAVQATVQAMPGAAAEQVREAVVDALDTFLHPLRGGPTGRGWPCGRSVYRAEILQLADDVPCVDHVLELELVPTGGDPTCGNISLAPTCLVTSGAHSIKVTA